MSQHLPVRIRVVRDVHPLPLSLDAALDSCETEWLLTVDADCILQPYCVERLWSHVDPGTGCVTGMLEDKVYGIIAGVRLLRVRPLKDIGYKYPLNDPYVDRKPINVLEQMGLKRVILRDIVGTHNPYGTDFEVFRRFFGVYRKRAALDRECAARPHLESILRYARGGGNDKEIYYMVAGLACAALVSRDNPRDYIEDKELSSMFSAVSRRYQ